MPGAGPGAGSAIRASLRGVGGFPSGTVHVRRDIVARQLAQRALELDPDLTEAHGMLGIVAAMEFDWPEATRRFRTVMARQPVTPPRSGLYACFDGCRKPRNKWRAYCIGLMAAVLRNAGESEKAAELLGKLRDDAYGGPAGLTCYHFSCGEIDSAVEWADKAVGQRFSGITATLIRPDESAADLISANIGDSRSHNPAQRWMHELHLHAPANVLHLEHRPAPRRPLDMDLSRLRTEFRMTGK